jgi:hypothetical protein
MRVIKLEAWELEHVGCMEAAAAVLRAAPYMTAPDVAAVVRREFGVPDSVLLPDLDAGIPF